MSEKERGGVGEFLEKRERKREREKELKSAKTNKQTHLASTFAHTSSSSSSSSSWPKPNSGVFVPILFSSLLLRRKEKNSKILFETVLN